MNDNPDTLDLLKRIIYITFKTSEVGLAVAATTPLPALVTLASENPDLSQDALLTKYAEMVVEHLRAAEKVAK